MNAAETIKEAFAAVRGAAPLRRLGVLSVLNVVFLALFVVGASAVLVGFATVAVTETGIVEWMDAFLLDPSALTAGLAIIGVLTLVSAALSVLQVAALGGLVTESDAVLSGESGSVGRGLREGFRRFLRIAAIWAIQAVPQLVVLSAETLVLYFTVSLPLQSGVEPSPDAFGLAQTLLTPLSLFASLATIPLHVVAMLALRFALVDDRPWRDALAAGWGLAKARFADVGLVYLMLMLAGMVAGAAIGLVVAVVVGIGFALSAVAYSGGLAAAIAVAAIVSVVVAVLGAVVAGWYSAFLAAVWTAAWRYLTVRLVAPHPDSQPIVPLGVTT